MESTPEQIRDRICEFLSRCTAHSLLKPVLKEDNGEAIPLEDGHYSVEARQGKVLLEVWNESRSVVRRVTGIRRESPAELTLVVRRMGAGESIARIQTSAKTAVALHRDQSRRAFAGRLRKMLAQMHPGWKVDHVSTDRDLARSFSSQIARARLSHGQEVWAVAGCAEHEGQDTAESALTQAIAWMHHLRGSAQARQSVVTGIKLFLPERFVETTALRLPYLNRDAARYELFACDNNDEAHPVPEPDFANLATNIPSPPFMAPVHGDAFESMQQLARLSGVEVRRSAAMEVTCAINGLVFARANEHGACFGEGDDWHTLNDDSMADAQRLATKIARLRQSDSPDRRHPFYTAHAERWLESIVLANVGALSGQLDPRFAYSQVPAMIGHERGIMDVLAVTRSGRLAVLELKASKDLDLPLQALDYWMRVKFHLDRGEFSRLGYFPGVQLRPDPPLLWLVIPAFEFHEVNEVVMRYLSPQVPMRCMGINDDWRHAVQVVSRM